MSYYDCQIIAENYVKHASFFALKLKATHKKFFDNLTAHKDS